MFCRAIPLKVTCRSFVGGDTSWQNVTSSSLDVHAYFFTTGIWLFCSDNFIDDIHSVGYIMLLSRIATLQHTIISGAL